MQALAQACAAATAPVLSTPRSVAQAKRSEEWPQWELAIGAELQSFFDHGVWEEGGCALPAGKTALPSHTVLDRKRDGRYKARLVTGGNHLQPGVDFNETFAPVCSYRTLRMIAAVAARHGLRLRHFDTKTAFLNGVLEEQVYVRPPAGFEYLAGGPGRVLRLRRAMYGFRLAPLAWNKCLEAELTKRGFVQSNADPGLWLLYGENGAVMCIIYALPSGPPPCGGGTACERPSYPPQAWVGGGGGGELAGFVRPRLQLCCTPLYIHTSPPSPSDEK